MENKYLNNPNPDQGPRINVDQTSSGTHLNMRRTGKEVTNIKSPYVSSSNVSCESTSKLKTNLLESVNKNIVQPLARRNSMRRSSQMTLPQETTLGIKPQFEEYDVQNSLENNSVNKYDENDRLSEEEIAEMKPRPKRNYASHRDKVESMQALDEIRDNMEIFKMAISKNISKLQKDQDKLQVGELRNNIISFRESVENEMKKAKVQYESEYNQIKEGFKMFKETVISTINELTKKHSDILVSMNNDMKNYHEEINKRIVDLDNNQKLHFDQLKFILENTSDDRTKALAGKFMIENEEEFEKNKQTYIKPSDVEIKRAVNRIQTRRMTSLKIVTEEKKEEKEKNDLMKTLSKRQIINKNMVEDTNKEVKGSEKKSCVEQRQMWMAVSEKMTDFLKLEENVQLDKMNRIKKCVYSVIACNRLNQLLHVYLINKAESSFNNFITLFSEGDSLLKNFVNDSVQVSLASIIKTENLNLDMTEYKSLTKNKDNTSMNDRYAKLVARIKGFLDNLFENTTSEKIGPQVKTYLKFLVESGNFIPFKMFTLFEHTRIETKYGCTSNLKEKHSAMILSFYILNKILVKYLMIDKNFLTNEARRKLHPNVVTNLKIIASVIFHETLELYRKSCPIVTTIDNFDEYCSSQRYISKNELFNFSGKRKKLNQEYLQAVKIYNKKHGQGCEFPNEITEALEKFNERLTSFAPDTDPNCPDFLQNCLYKSSDLNGFFALAKEKKFDLSQKLFLWIKQVLKIVKE